MTKELTGFLKKDNAKGIRALERAMANSEGSFSRLKMQEVDSLIDKTQVLELKDTTSGKINYTYRINHPEASETRFYNVVMRMWNGYRRVILIEYDMTTDFAADYYLGGDITKFTGRLAIEMIASEEGDPCEPESGGGGGLWESGVYDGVRDPGSGINGKQELIAAQFAVLGMKLEEAQLPDGDPGVDHLPPDPNNLFQNERLAFDLSDATGPGDEDEVGILDPLTAEVSHEENCEELKKLTDNANIKATFNDLKSKTTQNKENGYFFRRGEDHDTAHAAPPHSSEPNKIEMKLGGNIIGGSHTHPNPASKIDFPMFSYKDIEYLFLVAQKYNSNGAPKDYSMFVLTLTVPGGTYAIKINDFSKFTYSINMNKAAIDRELRRLYNNKETTDTTDSFAKDFLSMLKIFDLGVDLYKATEDSTGITGWGKLSSDPKVMGGMPTSENCN